MEPDEKPVAPIIWPWWKPRPAKAMFVLLALALPAHAVEQAAQSVVIYLKTAKVRVTKQVKDPATGKLKTVTVGSYNGFSEAAGAIKLMPTDPTYRIVLPSPYVKQIPCDIPAGKVGVCTDSVDSRLLLMRPEGAE